MTSAFTFFILSNLPFAVSLIQKVQFILNVLFFAGYGCVLDFELYT